MKDSNRFDLDSFISPDVSYAPVYVWVWNDICTRDIIDTQLSEMKDLGIRAFYILPEPKEFRPHSMPTNLSPRYLSPEYFELCACAFKKADSLGMRCWLYDEGGWPSGSACGKVLRDHPEYARRVLKVYERDFHAGEIYKKASPDVVAAFLNDKEIIPENYVFTRDASVTEYTEESEINGDADYADLMNKDAVNYFIEITHEKYADSIKDNTGKTVAAVFTDEPKAPSAAFSKDLAERYEKLYGESVYPNLPLIMGRADVTEDNISILYRWYDLCSRVFCDNFLLQCKKWANDHGIAFTGHMDKDHSPSGCMRGGANFNLMRALRCFDIPGIDVIWHQIHPENLTKIKDDMNGYNGFFPRYASSAAAQNGTKLAMTESFGVAGPGLTYDMMRYIAGYQAVRGINVFNLFNFPLGRKGEYLAQELPVFTQRQIYYRDLSRFNRYLERLSYIYTLGEHVCETGLYYPVSDFQGRMNAENAENAFDTLGRVLEDMTADFQIVDDDIIQSARGADEGYLRIGRAEYRHIIIPQNVYIPQNTRKVLDRFIKGGGRVSDNLSDVSPVICFEGTGLRAMRRKTEKEEILCFFREAGESGDYKIYLGSQSGFRLDLFDGGIQRLETKDGFLSLSLAVGETAVILLTEESLKADGTKEFKNSCDISYGFTLRKELELICDDNGFDNIKHIDKAVPVLLGDWSYLIGSAYSGSCVYETSFTLPDEKIGKEGELDLGEVHFTADVYLNGKHLGVKIMPPYRIIIPRGLLNKNNELKIIVTNTSANWYTHTDYFDNRDIKELSPYFEVEKEYAIEYASGGLYGPVTLYTQ